MKNSELRSLTEEELQQRLVSEKENLTKLNSAQFNCTQCHAPQAEISVDISNIFVPDFRDGSSNEKSNLSDNMDEGVK